MNVLRLTTDEFIRRFLIHTLPKGLHRIRHYGLFASGTKAENLSQMRELLDMVEPEVAVVVEGNDEPSSDADAQPCPSCGATMRIIEVFEAGCTLRHVASPEGIDSS